MMKAKNVNEMPILAKLDRGRRALREEVVEKEGHTGKGRGRGEGEM